MKQVERIGAAVLLSLAVGCSTEDQPVAPLRISTPERVSYVDVPTEYTDAFYFMCGGHLVEGPETLLAELVERRIRVREAWYPDPEAFGPCAHLILDQFIIRLDSADDRVLESGFLTKVACLEVNICLPTWLHYGIDR